MSNPFADNSNDHNGGHGPSGSQMAGFFTAYDEVLDRVEFGVAFECGCELMTALSLDDARMVRGLFSKAILAAVHHHEKGV
ncbi:hypothetical protein HLB23_39455 [Nocardia uniformis]|uniref:Uncharacterized protein n=1 Tax=Nocardia uniformis TaxID=53432 RepID=A0A849CG91_9NOCA|nr:hypothetical protein [Nocardia uniformis]NNH75865.1 hypothetical protein [Nocardia uniformis]